MAIHVTIPLDKSIVASGKIVKQIGDTDRRKLRKTLWFIALVAVIIVISFVIACAGYGHFVKGNALW